MSRARATVAPMHDDDARRALRHWHLGAGDVAPQAEAAHPDLHRQRPFNLLPSKRELRGGRIDGVLEGWKPEAPFIHADTRVIAFGSCFASNFILWLGDHGFNRQAQRSPYNMLLRFGFGFENVPVVAQQFRWAFGAFDGGRALWFDGEKQSVEASDESRRNVRAFLEDADVLILTFGLSEVWYDTVTGEPLWRAIPARHFDARRHAFRVLKVAETVASLEEIHRLRERFLPKLKIIFTVSPVRLRATFRPISAVTANSASKAILRASVDEFLRAHPDELGQTYFYFPSYELVTDVAQEPFTRDNRHVYPSVVDRTLALFTRFYTSLSDAPAPSGESAREEHPEHGGEELREIIRQLEASNAALQDVCNERQRVIEDLDAAARERLALIERLSAQCEEYRRVCEERAALIERLAASR
jgi:GSCFA family protein